MLSFFIPFVIAIQPTTQPTPVPIPAVDWVAAGEATLAKNKANAPITSQAKNIILFIADGMDVTTVSAARILAGQKIGLLGEEHQLAFETLPHLGLAKTYNTNAQTPDSAGTATAIVTGHKTRAGVISIAQNVQRGDCAASKKNELPSMMDLTAALGRSVGIVSTASITHATPATVYAHAANRNWEADSDMPPAATECSDIATQLIAAAKDFPLVVALGGGRASFLPKDIVDPEHSDRTGKRNDGVNLTDAWTALSNKHRYVWNAEQFKKLKPSNGEIILGLFQPSHMRFEADRTSRDESGEPSLAEMTEFAIDRLATEKNGFFLMVEGGRVDHAHHGGNARRALEEVIAFDAAVAMALEKTDAQDTLIIVTADHGHTLVFQGYPKRGNPILGLAVGIDGKGEPTTIPNPAADGKPYTTLAYGNGPGSPFARSSSGEGRLERPFVSDEEAQSLNYRQQSAIPSLSETHGGQDVAIYARGPMAHLVNGTAEQSYIYYVMREAFAPSADD